MLLTLLILKNCFSLTPEEKQRYSNYLQELLLFNNSTQHFSVETNNKYIIRVLKNNGYEKIGTSICLLINGQECDINEQPDYSVKKFLIFFELYFNSISFRYVKENLNNEVSFCSIERFIQYSNQNCSAIFSKENPFPNSKEIIQLTVYFRHTKTGERKEIKINFVPDLSKVDKII